MLWFRRCVVTGSPRGGCFGGCGVVWSLCFGGFLFRFARAERLFHLEEEAISSIV